MVNFINLKDRNDYMKARFADGVIADVLSFRVEDLCMGIKDENPKDYADKRIKEDRRNFELGKWNHVYIFSPTPRKQIIFGADGISTTTQLVPGHPTYRYSVICTHESKKIEVIWYDDAPPIYVGIYDLFQAVAGSLEFNKYAEIWD